jgi:hemolysin activation/secretion protein
MGAAYSHVHYRLGDTFAALGASGEAASGSAFVQYPLLRSRRASVYGGLAYERRVLEDRISAAGTVTDKTVDVLAPSLTGDFFDSWGGDAANAFSLRYTGGNLDIESPLARAIDEATVRANGGYHKWAVSFARLQGFTERWSAYVSFYGQKASRNLDSSEKLILGGANGVRAYPQGEAAGDSGYLLNAEVRYAFGVDALPGLFQATAFLDTGEVSLLEEPFAGLPNHRRLSGGGVGLVWTKVNDFSLRASIAHRCRVTARARPS